MSYCHGCSGTCCTGIGSEPCTCSDGEEAICRHCDARITYVDEPHEWFGTDGYWTDPVDGPGYGPDYCWVNLIDDHSAVGPHEPIEGEAK